MVSNRRNLIVPIEMLLYECLQVDVDTVCFIFIWTIPWFSWCWFIEIWGAEFLCLIVLFKVWFCHGVDSLFIHDTHHRFHFTFFRASRKDTWLRCNAWTGAMEKCPLTCKVCGTTPVPTPAPTSTVCADSTDRFSVTKPDKVTVVTNRSCAWWVLVEI